MIGMLHGRFGLADQLQVFFRPMLYCPQVREIGQRFGVGIGAAVQEMIERQALVDNLFFEQRIHHHALAPASSSLRMPSTFLESGEAEATSGFFSCRPR